MWTSALDRLLRHFFRHGRLHVTYPDGVRRSYGPGDCPEISVTLHDPSLPRRIVLSPDMGVGEGYMDGTFTIEGDDVYGFLSLAMANIAAQGQPAFRRPLEALRWLKRRWDQFNPAARAQANVAHHYDLSGELYDLFLDADRQYSCAYFAREGMTLEEAQEAKKRHIARKLLIRPGMRGRHPLARTARHGQHARREGGACGPGAVRVDGLPRRSGAVRPHRVGGHVRACRRAALRRLFRHRAAASGR
jgi:cyclopropane-fatty-acyl-phospholipid synthase